MIQVSRGMKPCKLVNKGVSQDVVAFIFRVRIDLLEESISSCVRKTGVCLQPSIFFLKKILINKSDTGLGNETEKFQNIKKIDT